MNSRYNRRDFIKQSSAVGVSLALANLGQTEPAHAQQAKEYLKVGFVGVGRRGSNLLKILLEIKGVRMKAFCDIRTDKIYRTHENRCYCKDKGIRLSGPPLGRPRQVTEYNKRQLKQAKQMQREDELDRIAIEDKFCQGKRRLSLDRIMAKLAETSEAVIMVSFIVMNLEKILSSILLFVLDVCLPVWTSLRWVSWRACNRIRWEQRLCLCDAKIC